MSSHGAAESVSWQASNHRTAESVSRQGLRAWRVAGKCLSEPLNQLQAALQAARRCARAGRLSRTTLR